MRLSKSIIEEFKAICRDEFDVDLSDVVAEQRALEVLDLFWLLFVERPELDREDGYLPNNVDTSQEGQVS